MWIMSEAKKIRRAGERILCSKGWASKLFKRWYKKTIAAEIDAEKLAKAVESELVHLRERMERLSYQTRY